MRAVAVLLAAGGGSRLGRGPKALLPFRGRPLVEHLAGELRAGGCSDVVIVLGAGADEVIRQCRLEGYRVVRNADWASGMGSSFRLGVAAAEGADAVVVALVDQPGVSATLIRRLLERHRPGRVTAAAYRAETTVGENPDGGAAEHRRPAPASGTVQPAEPRLQRGHPLVFDASLAVEAAAEAAGDAGARNYLRRRPELVDLVDCSDLGSAADVDTPADLPLLD
ncbi:nicotine blue oxidoreductase [Arthrobacter sp. USHLN218]|uniref:nicotine blue oxidoreductase n=1 Tax=Arthrobacter sp. USHLN218 TaxID=3081232 RepID=UPI003015B1B9